MPNWDSKRRSLPLMLGTTAVGLVLIVGGSTALLSSASHADVKPQAPVSALAVTTTEARFARLPLAIPASGTIQAVDEIVVGSEVAGLAISELLADEGDTVKKGQVLARLNHDILEAQLAQANAQIAAAQATTAEAQANLGRALELGKRGFASKQMIDQRQAAALSQRAQVVIHAAQRDELEARLAQTVIRAPADGVIATRSVAQGQVVGNGAELFRVIRDGKLEWKAELPDHQLTALREGQKATVTAGAAKVEGQIRLISETIDARSRNGVVHVALPVDERLRAGMFARGEMTGGEANVLTLPEAAVVTRDGQSFVFTLTREGRAQLTKIEAGVRTGKFVEVRRGLAQGQRVILEGAGLLSEGDQVRVTGHAPKDSAA